MDKIQVTPIGVIHTPYKIPKDIPIQGKFKPEVLGEIELDNSYTAGLKDLDGFSHAILLYYFHKSAKDNLISRPFLENEDHGVFAIRTPHRPNHIGLSIVKIEKIENNILIFSEVDILDGTPLLDIKPYVKFFDSRENTKAGWVEKHFEGDEIPEATILK